MIKAITPGGTPVTPHAVCHVDGVPFGSRWAASCWIKDGCPPIQYRVSDYNRTWNDHVMVIGEADMSQAERAGAGVRTYWGFATKDEASTWIRRQPKWPF